jgi:hypothetical protein
MGAKGVSQIAFCLPFFPKNVTGRGTILIVEVAKKWAVVTWNWLRKSGQQKKAPLYPNIILVLKICFDYPDLLLLLPVVRNLCMAYLFEEPHTQTEAKHAHMHPIVSIDI